MYCIGRGNGFEIEVRFEDCQQDHFTGKLLILANGAVAAIEGDILAEAPQGEDEQVRWEKVCGRTPPKGVLRLTFHMTRTIQGNTRERNLNERTFYLGLMDENHNKMTGQLFSLRNKRAEGWALELSRPPQE